MGVISFYVHCVLIITLTKQFCFAARNAQECSFTRVNHCDAIISAIIISSYTHQHLGDGQVESGGRWGNLNDGGARKDVLVGDSTRVIAGQEDVALALCHLWNGCMNHAIGNGDSDRNDLQARDKGSVEGASGHGLWLEIDVGSVRCWQARDEGEGWVGHDWESGVGGWAGGDETAGNGVNGVESERDAEGIGHWDLTDSTTGSRLVESFGNQDAGSGSEVCLGGDVLCSSEVCRDTDTLDDGGKSNESLGVGHREGVSASSDWLGTGSCETWKRVSDVDRM